MIMAVYCDVKQQQKVTNCCHIFNAFVVPCVRPYFFLNTWFMDFFQNIKVGGGKKNKNKIT